VDRTSEVDRTVADPDAQARRNTPRTRPRLLVVDDTETIRSYLADLLEEDGCDVDTAEDGERALALLEAGASPDVVLLDVMMPGIGGLETLGEIRSRWPEIPVIMVSIVGQAQTIVEAMRLGAADYLPKPVDENELRESVHKVLARRPGRAGSDKRPIDDPEAVVWRSQAMREIRGVIEQVSDTDVTVLIEGESGVGKEIVARQVHASSNRASSPFIKVNCAALPEGLLESELFGYEKGAFTGATTRKMGKFEAASGGTIFLDEIGEMSPGLQAKLLHVLQESRFARLGGNREIEVDVRVVTATHRPLVEMIADGSFREDLYFRLNVVNLRLPALRERREEIAPLVDTFFERFTRAYHRPPRQPSADLMEALQRHTFPGNVRELENMVKRIVVLETEAPILQELARFSGSGRHARRSFQDLLEEIEETAGDVPLREVGRRAAVEIEREAIGFVLDQTGWNRKQAAKRLGVSYKTLLQKIRDCELEPHV